jgi:hypothetical protein
MEKLEAQLAEDSDDAKEEGNAIEEVYEETYEAPKEMANMESI